MSNVHRFPNGGPKNGTGPQGAPLSVSPRFMPFAAAFLASGAALLSGIASGGVPVFVFVMSGWIVSLCLHEFGHAYVAWRGGDAGMRDRGYLTLDPFAYTQPLLSLILPALFLAMGGIGLPGGAVFVDRSRLRSRAWDSLVALAGPAATALFLLALCLPFAFGLDKGESFAESGDFWAGLAMLAYLQSMALIFNLLPLPGFDGFGALAYFLSPQVERKAMQFSQPALLLLILAIVLYPRLLWPIQSGAATIVDAFGVDVFHVIEGLRLFRFWS